MSWFLYFQRSRLVFERTEHAKPKQPKEELKFGRTMTDHMLEIDWSLENGWEAPRIKPYGPLAIDPAASSLHYALQCFEGMKAYLDDKNQIRLFRPDMNMKRLNRSMARLCMPPVNESQLLECLKELIRVERSWIPEGYGYSLYVRPTAISTQPFIGVGPPERVKV